MNLCFFQWRQEIYDFIVIEDTLKYIKIKLETLLFLACNCTLSTYKINLYGKEVQWKTRVEEPCNLGFEIHAAHVVRWSETCLGRGDGWSLPQVAFRRCAHRDSIP